MGKLRTDFERWEAPSAPYVRYLVKKVKEAGILIDKPKRGKPKTVLTPENFVAVAKSVCEEPSTSIHRCSQQLNISEISLRRILHKDLGMTPYKGQLFQELKLIDHPMRFLFAKWAKLSTHRRCRFWQKKIIFSDEAHFDLGEYLNKQNCCIWGTENPQAYIGKSTHQKRVTGWFGFWSRGIIGPFFFQNEQGEDVTVNGDRYRAMLN